MEQNPYSAPAAPLASSRPSTSSKSSGMDPNIKTARAHFALACLYGVVGLIVLVTMAGEPRMRGAMIAVCVILGGMFALHFAVSRGARKRRNWARVTSLVIGFLALPGFPMGTLIGIYLIASAWSEWVEPRTYSGDLTLGWPGERKDPSWPSTPVQSEGN